MLSSIKRNTFEKAVKSTGEEKNKKMIQQVTYVIRKLNTQNESP